MKKRLLTALAVLTGLFLLSASMVWAQAAPVPKTGQTIIYRTGDDGYHQKGVASPNPRFTNNGDGTVTDNLTGLMWAKDANLASGSMNWNDAIDYANNLSLGSDGCGLSYTDWRLPNRFELDSLLDLANYGPPLPSGHPFLNVNSGYYWSSTTFVNNTQHAWLVNMLGGNVQPTVRNKTYIYSMWPVRSDNSTDMPAPVARTGQTIIYRTGDDGYHQKGVASPNPRFTNNGDGTVTDNLTGLMWAQDANLASGSMNWNDAIDYANNLSLGSDGCGLSYTDWRLPNRFELESLLDPSNHGPPLPSGHPFLKVTSSYYWSSTAFANDPQRAWFVDMVRGWESNLYKEGSYIYVWPVRSGN